MYNYFTYNYQLLFRFFLKIAIMEIVYGGNIMVELFLGIMVIISTLLIAYVLLSNKFKMSLIKINKAEEEIAMYMQTKEDLLNRARTVISKELKKKDVLSELDSIPVDSSNIETHVLLKKIYNDFFKILDENEKLYKSKSLEGILNELNDNEENIVGSIKFYNDTVVDYNQLILAFPANFVAFFKRYKQKEFYNNEKRDYYHTEKLDTKKKKSKKNS